MYISACEKAVFYKKYKKNNAVWRVYLIRRAVFCSYMYSTEPVEIEK